MIGRLDGFCLELEGERDREGAESGSRTILGRERCQIERCETKKVVQKGSGHSAAYGITTIAISV